MAGDHRSQSEMTSKQEDLNLETTRMTAVGLQRWQPKPRTNLEQVRPPELQEVWPALPESRNQAGRNADAGGKGQEGRPGTGGLLRGG